MPDIVHVIEIDAPLDRVYEALTTSEGIRHWWTRDAHLDAREGGMGEFAFHQRQTVTRVRVEALEPPSRVVWATVDSSAPGGWDGTTISFDLGAEGQGTVLAFMHRGFREANEGYERVTKGWDHDLCSLQRYLQTGTGAPHG